MDFLDQYKGDRSNDLMSIADQSERLDYLSNLSRNNCVLLTGTYLAFYIKLKLLTTSSISGLKSKEFPKDYAEQHTKAVEMVKALLNKVLNREETFTLTVRKIAKLRYARDSSMIILPPLEVRTHT